MTALSYNLTALSFSTIAHVRDHCMSTTIFGERVK
jgi:hypothetical protein